MVGGCGGTFVGARFFFFQAEDGIRDRNVTGVQTCALPIYLWLPMSSGSTGTNITPSIRSNGAVTDVGAATWTICSVSGSCNNPTSLPAMTLAASQCGQMGSIVVNGFNYPGGTSEQAIAYNDADNFNYAQAVTVPSGIATAVANGCLIPGWANGGTISGDVGDLVLLNDTASSAIVIMQLNTGNGVCGSGIYCLP